MDELDAGLKAQLYGEPGTTFRGLRGRPFRTLVRSCAGDTFELQGWRLSFGLSGLQGYFVTFHEEHFSVLFREEHSLRSR